MSGVCGTIPASENQQFNSPLGELLSCVTRHQVEIALHIACSINAKNAEFDGSLSPTPQVVTNGVKRNYAVLKITIWNTILPNLTRLAPY